MVVPPTLLIRLFHQTGVRQEDDLESTDGLFDYISEEEYSKLVEERQRDCWILNDGNHTYY